MRSPSCRSFSSPTGSPCQTQRHILFVILGLPPSYITAEGGNGKTLAENHKAEQDRAAVLACVAKRMYVCEWICVVLHCREEIKKKENKQ